MGSKRSRVEVLSNNGGGSGVFYGGKGTITLFIKTMDVNTIIICYINYNKTNKLKEVNLESS